MSLAEVRERLRRPPAWGPNEQGDYMVDMTVEAYEQDLDALVAAAQGWDWRGTTLESVTNLGELLHTIREERHLSFGDASEQMEISKSTLHKIENGSDPRLSTAQKIWAWMQ